MTLLRYDEMPAPIGPLVLVSTDRGTGKWVGYGGRLDVMITLLGWKDMKVSWDKTNME